MENLAQTVLFFFCLFSLPPMRRLLPVELLDNIWHPDTYFRNAKRVEVEGEVAVPNRYLKLLEGGTLSYLQK